MQVNNITLYELTDKYAAILREIEDSEEITREQEEKIDALDDAIETKVINVAKFRENIKAEKEAVEDYFKKMKIRYEKKIKHLESEIDKWENYIKVNMDKINLKKVKSPDFDITIINNPQKPDIYDEKSLPPQYFREKTSITINKELILDDLKNNIQVPGARLTNGRRIKIY